MFSRSYIYYKEKAVYPDDIYFRPSTGYPEYQYAGMGLSEQPNDVYEMVRNMFIALNLDKEHIGKNDWNPLGEYISQNDTVLVKPNLVKHFNEAVKGKRGMECLITHPSVIRAIVDYVLIALKGTGKIIVADAPVQSCDFDKLKRDAGFIKLEEFYRMAGEGIVFEDLRNYRSIRNNGHVMNAPVASKYEGKTVNLGTHSYFYNSVPDGRLRITNYDYRKLNRHHKGARQEYCVSEACLQADVVINLPKPKTHRKAGYTGALKNMVGISADKEFLPHHTKGSYADGIGDEYFSSSISSKIRSNINDMTDILDKKSLYRTCDLVKRVGEVLIKEGGKKVKYSEGSWWGNHTIYKTVLDLNTIVMYADKNGSLKNTVQRRVITVGDMIISGEKEGPLLPMPKETGMLVFADNNVLFDEILVRLMGFHKDSFILLNEARKNKKLSLEKYDECVIQSNHAEYTAKLDELKSEHQFMPAKGWMDYLR